LFSKEFVFNKYKVDEYDRDKVYLDHLPWSAFVGFSGRNWYAHLLKSYASRKGREMKKKGEI
jgi:hypothetical protein